MSTESFADLILPAPVNGGFRRENDWIWCGSVVRGDDGLFHMFASMWTKRAPFNPHWLTHSRVVRAVSRTPEGPYEYVEDVLPPRGEDHWDGMMTHNPTVHRYGNQFLLFYTGTTFDASQLTYGPISDALRTTARRNQRIGLAIADSPAGPWHRPDGPCLDVRPGHWDALITTNAAPCILPGGEILLLYKSTTVDAGPIQYGVAWAESLELPFERIGPDAPITFEDAGIAYEDAYVWRQGDQFHMIFKDITGRLTGELYAGAEAVSRDGITWKLASSPKAYSRRVEWTDGRTTVQGAFERPQLLLQDGVPTHLFAATGDGPGGFQRALHTWNMVVPLRH